MVARCPRAVARRGEDDGHGAAVAAWVLAPARASIERSLVGAVPSAASWRLSGLPRALEPEQVDALLASCDRRRVTGRRDFAILTMLVRLGLRAGEVAALSLEDVDWRAGELVVRGKGTRAERLPLPVDVGEAIVALPA